MQLATINSGWGKGERVIVLSQRLATQGKHAGRIMCSVTILSDGDWDYLPVTILDFNE